jgi:tetratricopeptide (TPR) repeat protein
MVATTMTVSATLAFLFWLWHAEGLAALNRVNADTIALVLAQVRRSEQILTRYYVYLFILLLGLAGLLRRGEASARFRWPSASPAIAAGLLLLVMVLSSATNLRVIQADIAFKTGEVFAHPGSWPVAIEIYNRARDLAPNEDYYDLFLGRAYLEHAKTIQDEQERERLIAAAAEDLKEAQRINPLNTDHTANLARLYSLWCTFSNDPVEQATRASLADEYFAKAVSLSPKNARLWDEWAAHTMNNLNDPQTAYQRLQQALEIDPYYDWTYGLIGDYYGRFISKATNVTAEEKEKALIQAAEYYTKALSLAEPDNLSLSYGYLVSYAGVVTQLGNLPQAILAYERAVQLWPDNPDRWRIEAALAQLYAQLGDLRTALQYAQSALALTPQDQRASVEELIRQYGGQP